jgi:DNA-binding CsgD family transcriptional regulator
VKARLLLEESIALLREIGYRLGTAELLFLLGKAETREGAYTTAYYLYKESLVIGRERGDKLSIAIYLEGWANLVALQADTAWAAQLWGMAEALRVAMGTPIPPVYSDDYDRSVATARAQLGEQAFATAWVEGGTMTLDQVLGEQGKAKASTPAETTHPARPMTKPSASSPDGLTAREVEVLRLLAQGLTSAQIAEQLVISVVTVNFHVRSIYSKLGVTSRAAATRYAVEHHLV